MNKDKTMNIGIIGLGARSEAYVTNLLQSFPQHRIMSVCEIDEERLENYTQYYFKTICLTNIPILKKCLTMSVLML